MALSYLRFRGLFFLLGMASVISSARGHYHLLLPDPPSAKKGEAVSFLLRWGHPFEHQFFEVAKPKQLSARLPDGKRIDLLNQLEKDPKVAAYHLRFVPEQRGDYVLSLTASPVWMEEDSEFLEDTVKVILHVQAQKGWDSSTGHPFELTPLTRPYGLRAGTVFQAQVLVEGKPLAGTLVEIERYNPTAPKELPADEHITHTVKTDPNGVVTCSLPEPGWWCLTASRPAGKRAHKGKDYPVRQRASLWIHVDQPTTVVPSKK